MFDLRIKFGAFDNEKLIGLAIGADYDGGVALIYWLAVDEAYRNQGIGTNLLKHFEDFLKENGYHNVHLNADERNLDFYKKLGYKVIGREEKGFYGANDFILSKILQEPKEENFFKMKIDQ